MASSSVVRELLFESGNCRFSTFGEDFTYKSKTYKPGIIVTDRYGQAGAGSVTLIPSACEEILTERNIGDPVYLIIIQQIGNGPWITSSSHWYLLGEFVNQGFSKWQLSFADPMSILGKSDSIYWDHEYIKRKYDDDWFQNISRMKENLFKITMDK